jgi:hypothetical protein
MSLGRLNDTAIKLRQENRALSLRQLGAAYGLGYTRIKQMQALPGFPLIAGKVIPSDFDQWRLIRTTGLSSLHREDRLRSAVGKARALKSKSDLPTSWRQIANSLKAAVSSLGLPEGNENSDV